MMQEKISGEGMRKAGYKVVISGTYYKDKTFPSLNDYLKECGENPRSRGKMKRDYMIIANNAIRRSLKRWKPKSKISLHYRFYEPKGGHMRDHMNIFSFFDKIFQDSLVKCAVIKDDSPEYVDGNLISHKFFYTSKTPFVEIGIEEVE